MPDSPTQASEASTEYLKPVEVLAKLRISRRTLERYIDRGVLPAQRLPSGHRRFLRQDVDALLVKDSA